MSGPAGVHFDLSYSLNSLEGGYIGDCLCGVFRGLRLILISRSPTSTPQGSMPSHQVGKAWQSNHACVGEAQYPEHDRDDIRKASAIHPSIAQVLTFTEPLSPRMQPNGSISRIA